ncbi:adenomatous polyposis coli protein 2 [Tachyglossus aculeatus]|uniref:adenomatous polyposis coli protein 2 n=1 Tax=Tachyglossus aculeatus TaxID=9261 RepID=UPI0018F6EC6B|nr:adenomatous polyposis coli protein 2 [Tachyglossus aculeatus]
MGLLWLLSFMHSAFFGEEVLEELKMSGSIASYDQLVHQVEVLKKENTHLRRELEDNSSHLSKLENETSDMKVVLKHLQSKLEQEARIMVSSGRMEMLEQLEALQMDIASLYNLKFHSPALAPEPASPGPSPKRSPPPGAGPAKKDSLGELSRATVRLLQELDKERCFLLSEIEKEEKEKLWYYTQLQSLSKRLDELPHVETFSMQMDLIRQQLEFEAQHIRSLMEERFGTTDEMVQRAQIRASRLEQIDKELLEAQDRVHHVEPQTQPSGKPACSEGDGDVEAPTHPEDGGSQLGNSKVEVVFWLLSMLATRDKEDMARTLLAMSSSQESCLAMRKSGCLPLLVQILHDADREPGPAAGGGKDARMRANAALHNIIFSQPDEGQAKKEMRVLHVLEQIRSYSETCWDWLQMQGQDVGRGPEGGAAPVPIEPQICQATCAVMKLSFDEEYRRAMNELGGLQAVAELLQVDYEMHRMTSDPLNLALRRYAGMALTNLTFGDVVNKATLCARRGCMQAIVAQLTSESEELHQVVSSILRNLSWRADINSKKILREVGSMTELMQCALRASKESTLKSVLSALWNLSAHSTENKAAICLVEGALGFLVSTLTYKCQSNSLAIIESGGGILRNVSSLIATREDYRQVLRDHNCLQTLLQHLKSHSLTIVSNACGTLWNLSARSARDQELLWDLGAVSMLRNLIHSKHKMIAMGSAAALRNLLSHRPLKYKDAAAVVSPGSCMPSLYVRKQKALEAELDAKHLAEALDTLEGQSLKGQPAKKPLRHLDSLVRDYASDSGCFDDDEGPGSAPGVEATNPSVLSMFLNSSFLQGQALPRGPVPRRGPEPERDDGGGGVGPPKAEGGAAQLASKLAGAAAKMDKLVEDVSALHTSSDDSFSLSSGDPGLDWAFAPEGRREARAQSCSPCRLPEPGARREAPGRGAHPLLRLKATYASLSNDSLNSGSTSDGYCPRELMRPCPRAPFADYREELQRYQQRPSRLDLKGVPASRPEKAEPPGREQQRVAQRPVAAPGAGEREGRPAAAPQVHTIKLSPSYQHVPLLEGMAKAGRRQAWPPGALPPGPGGASKVPAKPAPPAGPPAQAETLQRYSVEDTPICFSRCSSLSSLSSADHALSRSEDPGLDSDSSLEILDEPGPGEGRRAGEDEEEEGEGEEEEEEDEDEGEGERDEEEERWRPPGTASLPVAIPAQRLEKTPGRGAASASPPRPEDRTPSSSSENYVQETPLVMSRCSSVSSLGSFESPSIASSIQSDPCSEMISGTVSPSELPDSPGQTMPPSRNKTPLPEPCAPPEREASQFNLQWENNVKKFMDITDFKERFQLPPDLDSMIYFTVEKPVENFSCASSLSALPLHEHYVQKDVELKLMPPFSERGGLHFAGHGKREELERAEAGGGWGRPDPHSDDELDILKECISSAMPSRFRKAQAKKARPVPVYMLVPAHASPGQAKAPRPSREPAKDEDSFTDSAEGTPVNFSSGASLSDETLHDPSRAPPRAPAPAPAPARDCRGGQGPPGSRKGWGSGEPAGGKQGPPAHSTPTKGSGGPRPPGRGPAPEAAPRGPRKDLPRLELTGGRPGDSRRPPRGGGPRQDGGPGEVAFQSLCHTTPTEEAVYCFYENDSDEAPRAPVGKAPGLARPSKKERRPAKKEAEPGAKPPPGRSRPPARLQHNLIVDETPPCYSLSSSLSSLSDLDLSEPGGAQPAPKAARLRPRGPEPLAAPPSSPSVNSDEEDLPPRGPGAAAPRRRRPSARRRQPKAAGPKSGGGAGREREPGEEPGSDRASDLDSVEWKAIQEGANSIVTWLHQAAASFSREPSSESDSILSFVSGLSVGSTLQPSRDRKEADRAERAADGQAEREAAAVGAEGRQVAAERPSDARPPRAPEKPPGAQKTLSGLPVVFRGRTVIYMPSLPKDSASPRSTPKKTGPKAEPPAKPLAPANQQQRSRSLHRPGKISELTDLTLPKRSATPPAQVPKAPSSGSSRTSPPSRPPPKKPPPPPPPPPAQLGKPPPAPSPKAVGASPSPPARAPGKIPGPKQPKTQKSPVRIPFMQKPVKKTFPARGPMPVLEEQGPGLKPAAGGPTGIPQSGRLNLVRTASARSSGSESDRSGFLRQLTFIKESSGLLRRHRSELSSSESGSSLSRSHSPGACRARPGLPAVFLCSSRCQELKAHKPGVARPGQRPAAPRMPPGPPAPSGARPPRRTSSESPSRLPVKTHPPAPEPFKRYSSSPQINIVKRTGSPSPTLSPCSEAGGRRRRRGRGAEEEEEGEKEEKEEVEAEEEEKTTWSSPAVAAAGEGPGEQLMMMKGTWRRIRDEDIPHILKSTLPPTALPLVGPAGEGSGGGSSPLRKTSDAVVQTEDFSASKTNSSTSPTLESREPPTAPFPASTPFLGSDVDGPAKPVPAVSFAHEGPIGGFPASRHGSPSRAARVTPFNYVPSPMVVPAVSDKPLEKAGGLLD